MIPGVGLLAPWVEKSKRKAEDYPFTSFRFSVEIKGIIEAEFSAVSGLSIETEVVPYQEGGQNTFEHKLKGQTKYSNLVLKRGVTQSKDFYDWVNKSVNQETSKLIRQNGFVVIFDDTGAEKIRWEFIRAWPCKFEGPQFDTGQSSVLIESLELAHHGLFRRK